MKKLCFIFFFISSISTNNPIVILVHGTFAAGEKWARPGGEFYDRLEKSARKYNQKLIPFTWTGGATHKDRIQGAEALAKVIISYPINEPKILIGHSHGGNVIGLATQMLSDPFKFCFEAHPSSHFKSIPAIYTSLHDLDSESIQCLFNALQSIHNELSLHSTRQNNHDEYLIDRIYLLATPIDLSLYHPNMNLIKYVFNLYSAGDIIQPVLGFYRRLFSPHERIINFRVTIENSWLFSNPSHASLHNNYIADWILDIPEYLQKHNIGNFEHYTDKHNGKIHFDSNGPSYKVDLKTTEEREKHERERIHHTNQKPHQKTMG